MNDVVLRKLLSIEYGGIIPAVIPVLVAKDIIDSISKEDPQRDRKIKAYFRLMEDMFTSSENLN